MAADFAYSVVQVWHNFGAIAVVGSPAAAWLWTREQCTVPNTLAWLTVSGWIVQTLSGIGFGLTSYFSRGELPEIEGVALFALYIKMGCAIGGFFVSTYYLKAVLKRRERMQSWIWPCLLVVGTVALTCAAFLRWFG